MKAAEVAKVAASQLRENIAPIAGKAVGGYLLTVVGMGLFGLLLAGIAGGIAAEGGGVRALLAAVIGFGLGVGAGLLLAPKRAVSAALAVAVRKAGLGKRACALLFERLLDVAGDELHGDRGVAVAQIAERVPLEQAEKRLRAVVDKMVRAPGDGSGMRARLARKIRGALLERVEQVTLAHIRVAGQQHGGVNLSRAQAELAEVMDDELSGYFESSASRATGIALAGASVLSIAAAVALRVA